MIKDSGERKVFESGAVRDITEGKGRCDLLPLDTISEYFTETTTFSSPFLESIEKFKLNGRRVFLYSAIQNFFNENKAKYDNFYNLLLQLSKHFEEGAKKYGEDNWKKGIPASSYIDSAIRHYFKFKSGQADESHDIACVWNLICCAWTCEKMPKLNGYYVEEAGE